MEPMPGVSWLLTLDEVRELPGVEALQRRLYVLNGVAPIVAGVHEPRCMRYGGELLPANVRVVTLSGWRTTALYLDEGIVRVRNDARLVVVGWFDNASGEPASAPPGYARDPGLGTTA
jgi:hypothetical protein